MIKVRAIVLTILILAVGLFAQDMWRIGSTGDGVMSRLIPSVTPTPSTWDIEDYTTYTVVDDSSRLTIDTHSVVITAAPRNETIYLYGDAGAGFYDGDFVHNIDVNLSGGSQNGARMCIWGMSNVINTLTRFGYDNSEAVCVTLVRTAGNLDITIDNYFDNVGSTHRNLTVSTDYYLTISRDYDGGASSKGRYTCYIYSDSTRATLVDTIYVDATAQKDFRYFFGINGLGGGVGVTIIATASNLEVVTYEDLTTYTSVDPEGNYAITSNQLTITDFHTEHTESYANKDLTADYLSEDGEIQFEFVITDPNHGDDSADAFGLLAYSNTPGTTNSGTLGPIVYWTPDVTLTSNKIRLYSGHHSYATTYLTFNTTPTTVFYCTMTRVSAPAPGDCSVLIDVWSDAARTVRMPKSVGGDSGQFGRNDIPSARGLVDYRYLQVGTAERDSWDNAPYGSYYVRNIKIISH